MQNNQPALDCEYGIVGSLCIEPRCIKEIIGKLSAEDFEIAACAAVFESARDAYSRGKAFDAVMAADCISRIMAPADAQKFIVGCMDVTPTAANVGMYAKLVRTRAGKRKLNGIMAEIFNIDDPREAAASMVEAGRSFLLEENPKRLKTLAMALEQMYDNQSRSSLRLDTGFPRLDGILKGIWGGNLILIGARTGVGKTAFALDIARTVARRGNKTLIYSLEMLADEIAERLVAREIPLSLDTLIDNDLDKIAWQNVNRVSAELSKLPVYINDDPTTTVSRMRAEAISIEGLKLIIVDFITLMRSDRRFENRNLEVGAISRGLKNLASELQIPIIALAQLNRGADDTEQPTLRSLRDSGELEQNANKVMLMWNIDKELGDVGISVAKNRRGKTGVVRMKFYGEFMKYVECSEAYVPKKKKRRAYDDDDES